MAFFLPTTMPTTPIKENSPAISLTVSLVGSNLAEEISSRACFKAAR